MLCIWIGDWRFRSLFFPVFFCCLSARFVCQFLKWRRTICILNLQIRFESILRQINSRILMAWSSIACVYVCVCVCLRSAIEKKCQFLNISHHFDGNVPIISNANWSIMKFRTFEMQSNGPSANDLLSNVLPLPPSTFLLDVAVWSRKLTAAWTTTWKCKWEKSHWSLSRWLSLSVRMLVNACVNWTLFGWFVDAINRIRVRNALLWHARCRVSVLTVTACLQRNKPHGC